MRQASRSALTSAVLVVASAAAYAQPAGTFYSGFELPTKGPRDGVPPSAVTRVASGTDGIDSSTGAWHAKIAVESRADGLIGLWNRDADVFPSVGFTTLFDVYLDVDQLTADAKARLALSSSIHLPNRGKRIDFVLTIRPKRESVHRLVAFVSQSCSASRSASDDSQPIDVSSGWYTVRHTFRDHDGNLALRVTVLDRTGRTIVDWRLEEVVTGVGEPLPTSEVGGSAGVWVCRGTLPTLAIDNVAQLPSETLERGRPPWRRRELVLSLLSGLSPSGAVLTDESVQAASDELYESLDSSLWIDQNSLALNGREVFRRDHAALIHLRTAVNDGAPNALGAIFSLVSAQVVESDLDLVEDAVASATDGWRQLGCSEGSQEQGCDKAEKALGQAEASLKAAKRAYSEVQWANTVAACEQTWMSTLKMRGAAGSSEAQAREALDRAFDVARDVGCDPDPADRRCLGPMGEIAHGLELMERARDAEARGDWLDSAALYRKAQKIGLKAAKNFQRQVRSDDQGR